METEAVTREATPPPPPTPEPTKQQPSLIPINEHGQMMPQDHSQLARLAQQMLRGGMVPKGYDTVEKVITAWNFAASLKLIPSVAIRNIAVIDGTPSMYGDLPLSLAQRSGELEEFAEFCFDKDYQRMSFENKNLNAEPFGAVCIMKREGREKQSYSFTVEDAKKAQLWGKTSSSGKLMPWSAYPKTMLVRRARSMAIKTEFADQISGAAITEYDFNEAPDMRDVTPEEEAGSKTLNKIFGDENAKAGTQEANAPTAV